ncbi:hypothetical protein J3F83DRAFT_740404 [Trichoderma novae-zelandiae]
MPRNLGELRIGRMWPPLRARKRGSRMEMTPTQLKSQSHRQSRRTEVVCSAPPMEMERPTFCRCRICWLVAMKPVIPHLTPRPISIPSLSLTHSLSLSRSLSRLPTKDPAFDVKKRISVLALASLARGRHCTCNQAKGNAPLRRGVSFIPRQRPTSNERARMASHGAPMTGESWARTSTASGKQRRWAGYSLVGLGKQTQPRRFPLLPGCR